MQSWTPWFEVAILSLSDFRNLGETPKTFGFPHVRNEKLGSRDFPKVLLTYFPKIIREMKFLAVLLFVPKTNLHT